MTIYTRQHIHDPIEAAPAIATACRNLKYTDLQMVESAMNYARAWALRDAQIAAATAIKAQMLLSWPEWQQQRYTLGAVDAAAAIKTLIDRMELPALYRVA